MAVIQEETPSVEVATAATASDSESQDTAQEAPTEVAFEDLPQRLVIYTDGGARPNPGAAGWGMHGYLYVTSVPKKASGHPDYVCTARGYMSKALSSLRMGAEGKEERRRYDRSLEVTPIHYVDGYGGFIENVTNNVAELEAAIQAMRYAREHDITELRLYTDSAHVVDGLNDWTRGWIKNGWVKKDGTPVANVAYWKKLIEERDLLKNRGVLVLVEWVKSHTDNNLDQDAILGNIIADKLASAGVAASRLKQAVHSVTKSDPEAYWKESSERHPMVALQCLYFNSAVEYCKAGEYYLGNKGGNDNDIDQVGKRVSDGAYAVVRLSQADPVLEMLRSHQCSISTGINSIIRARLDQIFQPSIYQELVEFGPHGLEQKTPHRLDLQTLKKQPITREMNPPLLAMRTVEVISDLADLLDRFLKSDPSITVTDLTSILYETSTKTSKKGVSTTEVKLKAEYNVGYAALQIDANYQTPNGVASAPVTLTLGIDMLDRNALKRLEDKVPKVSLITWLEDTDVFRYATVIQAGSDVGIWAGWYSNRRIVV